MRRSTTRFVGPIYREMIIGKTEVEMVPARGRSGARPITPPNQGMADTLEEAQAAKSVMKR